MNRNLYDIQQSRARINNAFVFPHHQHSIVAFIAIRKLITYRITCNLHINNATKTINCPRFSFNTEKQQFTLNRFLLSFVKYTKATNSYHHCIVKMISSCLCHHADDNYIHIYIALQSNARCVDNRQILVGDSESCLHLNKKILR